MEIALLAAAGFISGMISGMGIGGGVILIPALTLLLGFEQKTAQGINLLYFIPTGAVALWVHFKNRSVEFKTGWPIAAFGIISAVAGAFLAGIIPSAILRRIFAFLVIFIGINEIFIAVKNKG